MYLFPGENGQHSKMLSIKRTVQLGAVILNKIQFVHTFLDRQWCSLHIEGSLKLNACTAGAVSIATISEKRPGVKFNYLLSYT